jgi:sugar phosphate isomerase/epimerase
LKFAFITFSCPTATWVDALNLARRHGYDGIEPRAQSRHGHGVEVEATPEQRAKIRQQATDRNVTICSIPTSCAFTIPEKAPMNVALAKKHVDLAADVGAKVVRVFPGLHPNVEESAARQSLVNALRGLAPYAQQRNVHVAVETHDSICDPRAMTDVMRQIDHPNIGVVWDVMHTQRQGKMSMTEAWEELRPWVRHVHVHDGFDRLDVLKMTPIGTGDFDHREVLRVLKRDGYDGFVSGEWIAGLMDEDFFSAHLPSEIATLRKLDAETQ